jgi:hypothetical protein
MGYYRPQEVRRSFDPVRAVLAVLALLAVALLAGV